MEANQAVRIGSARHAALKAFADRLRPVGLAQRPAPLVAQELLYGECVLTYMKLGLGAFQGLFRLGASVIGISSMIVLGVACLSVSVLQSWRLVGLIIIERQGKCDFVPCADQGTYVAALLFVLMGLAGVGLLAGALLLILQPRSST
jgi:hypothetical protein